MAATFAWSQSNGAGETITDSIGSINMGSNDSANLVPETYPITAGNNSYEVYVRGKFTGTYTKVDNLQFWKSAGAYQTGETIFWTGSVQEGSYATPTASASSVAVGSIPTADPGTANVSIGGSLSGSLFSSGAGDTGSYTDYIVMQTETTSSTPAGATNIKTFTIQWDEQ